MQACKTCTWSWVQGREKRWGRRHTVESAGTVWPWRGWATISPQQTAASVATSWTQQLQWWPPDAYKAAKVQDLQWSWGWQLLQQLPDSVALEARVCKIVLVVVPGGQWRACSCQPSNECLSSEFPVKHPFCLKEWKCLLLFTTEPCYMHNILLPKLETGWY